MNYSFVGHGALLVLGSVFVIGGCSSDSSSNSATTSSSSSASTLTPQSTKEPQRSNTGAQVKPPTGFGNAQGRVLWNEKPASGIKVQLCESISFVSGCGGKTYSARTDKDGNYTVDKVPPGSYGLAVQVFDTDTFIYPTNGILSAAKYTIAEGQTLDIRATNLFKTNLQTLWPEVGEKVTTGLPDLKWNSYEGAATYEIRLASKGSGGETQNLKTAETHIAPETPLLNGDYTWTVTARNSSGIKIAETSDESSFKVSGQSGSAKITLESPRPDELVAGSGIVFRWQKHPLANGYKIYLNQANTIDAILAFEKVEGNSYTLEKTLTPGSYFWSIQATRDGKQIAASELQSFRVK